MEHNVILKKILRKFLISIFTVLYSFIAFTQATFAWIVLNNELILDDVEIGIIKDSYFHISVDGKKFSNSITNEELSKAVKYRKLNDITSIDGINFYERDNDEKLDYKNNLISFPLWFRVKKEDFREEKRAIKGLFLVDNVNDKISYEVATKEKVNGTFVVSKGYNWTSNLDFQYGDKEVKAGDVLFCEASKAVRIAVIEENLEEEYGVPPKNDLRKIIYDPTENPKLGYGVKTGAYDYYNKNKGIELKVPDVLPNTLYSLSDFDSQHNSPYKTNDDTSMCATFQLVKDEYGEPWYYTKVTINIWLEGWDADCLDGILYDNVLIQLKFRGSNLTLK